MKESMKPSLAIPSRPEELNAAVCYRSIPPTETYSKRMDDMALNSFAKEDARRFSQRTPARSRSMMAVAGDYGVNQAMYTQVADHFRRKP